MNEFRKSYINPDRGMTVGGGRDGQAKIIDSMAPAPKGLPAGVRKINLGKHLTDNSTEETGEDMRNSNEPRFAVETFTPARAAEVLQKNFRNRKIKDLAVRRYIHSMKSGQWDHTGEPIKFDTDGNLVDGQHRLTAIVESGVTLRLSVAYNISKPASAKLDGGVTRSHGDRFVIDGKKNGTRLVAAIKMFYMLSTGKSPNLLTYEDCCDIYTENSPSFSWMESAFAGNGMYDNAVIAGALALAYNSDPRRIAAFTEQLHTGVGMEKGSPVSALRESIIGVKTSKKSRNTFGDLIGRYKFALKVLRAASLYLEGQKISSSNNLYATPIGLRYFIPGVEVPNFMLVDDQG